MGLNPFKAKKQQAQEQAEQLRWLTKLAREDLLELGERLEDEALRPSRMPWTRGRPPAP